MLWFRIAPGYAAVGSTAIAFALIVTQTAAVGASSMMMRANEDVPLPPMWNDARMFDELPKNSKGLLELDPWLYLDRLGAFREMVERTNDRFPCIFPQWWSNYLWGLPLQFGWQHDSGRLNMTSGDQSFVSVHSWWADMNYVLSIVPLLGANASGTLKIPQNLRVLEPAAAKDTFCVSSTPGAPSCDNFRTALEAWRDYFAALPAVEESCKAGNGTQSDTVLQHLWAAHTASLDTGLNKVKFISAQLSNLASEEEAKFGTSWANLVDFLALARFNPFFNGTAKMQRLLPMRMLHKNDKPPHISNMSAVTNRGIEMIELLATSNRVSKGKLLDLWAWAMCAPSARAEARDLISTGIFDPSTIVPDVWKIIRDAVGKPRDKPCQK